MLRIFPTLISCDHPGDTENVQHVICIGTSATHARTQNQLERRRLVWSPERHSAHQSCPRAPGSKVHPHKKILLTSHDDVVGSSSDEAGRRCSEAVRADTHHGCVAELKIRVFECGTNKLQVGHFAHRAEPSSRRECGARSSTRPRALAAR
jgi:hypothetical protein